MKSLKHRLFNQPGLFLQHSLGRWLLACFLSSYLSISPAIAQIDYASEYRIKAAFIYNFIAFTQWPSSNTDPVIRLCVYGADPFEKEIDKLENKSVLNRHIKVERTNNPQVLNQCQVIFFSRSVGNNLPNILKELSNQPILTISDTPDAMTPGIIINMSLVHEKVVFEINLGTARQSELDISSKLLQIATKVHF